jgi:acetyltransferase-like isoleucine patch superfamily enzyme
MKHFKTVMVVTYETIMGLILGLPRFRCCLLLKTNFLRFSGARIGRRVIIYPGVWIMPGRNLVLGDDVDLAKDVLLMTGGGVSIGARTLVGFRTQIISGNHVIPPVGQRIFNAGRSRKPITIGEDAWIGANCIILPSVSIGNGAVIGAGSVVTKDIPANCIAVGSPAKVIKKRKPKEMVNTNDSQQ